MNELLFYALLAEVVRNYPATREYSDGGDLLCSRPNTFAVLSDLTDLNAENLLKSSPRYRELPYFYSRKWELSGFDPAKVGFEYPVFAVVPQSFQFSNRNDDAVMSIDVAILDQNAYPAPCAGYCMNRTYEEHMHDCRVMLRRVLDHVQRYMIYQSADRRIGYYPKDEMPEGEWEFIAGVDALINRNWQAQYIRDVFQDNVSGMFGQLQVTITDCYAYEDDWVLMRDKYFKLNTGCSTC